LQQHVVVDIVQRGLGPGPTCRGD